MERALVVVEPSDTAKELAYEAGVIAEGLDADMVLTHVTTEQEYSARRGAMESLLSSSASYTVGEAKEGATQFARDIGDEVSFRTRCRVRSRGSPRQQSRGNPGRGRRVRLRPRFPRGTPTVAHRQSPLRRRDTGSRPRLRRSGYGPHGLKPHFYPNLHNFLPDLSTNRTNDIPISGKIKSAGG